MESRCRSVRPSRSPADDQGLHSLPVEGRDQRPWRGGRQPREDLSGAPRRTGHDRARHLGANARISKSESGDLPMNGHAISFGPFRLLAMQRLLLESNQPVRLGSRAFDILAALVERAGEVVGKEELIARAWPDTYVEEANLKIQVSALRRALGDGQGGNRYVITVPGRGYNFIAPIRREEPPRASSSPTIAPAALHNLPFATTRMIGREEIVTQGRGAAPDRLVGRRVHKRRSSARR